MLLEFIVTILSVFIFFLISLYFLNRKQIKSLTAKLALQTAEQKNLQVKEQELNTEVSNLKTKLQHTLTDPVTSLLARHLFEDRLNQSIKESERYQLTLGVLLVDIDDFRMVNDALSYSVGDELLENVAMRLQNAIRKVDSVTRISKDTFAILLTQLSKPELAALVAQRILQSFNEGFQIQENELYLTACIGIAIYPHDGIDAASMIRSADQALHLAKEKGNNIYQFYQEKMHAKSQRELILHNSMNRETIFQELILYYQPIVNVLDESIFCMDALIHWQHRELGLIAPSEVFMHAEKQRKLNFITEWSLKNACKQFLHWRSLGVVANFIGIPISATQLENIQFIYHITQILQELEFNPEWLLLEIKSGFHLLSHPTLEKAFNMFKYLGIKIALDHFGAEFFSLNCLKNIDIQYLKLDPALIVDIENNQRTLALMKSILFLGRSLSMQVIIQGIESDNQITLLKELGYVLMQGHLLGAPLSEHEVSDKIVAM